jgi:hypothetical protein
MYLLWWQACVDPISSLSRPFTRPDVYRPGSDAIAPATFCPTKEQRFELQNLSAGITSVVLTLFLLPERRVE